MTFPRKEIGRLYTYIPEIKRGKKLYIFLKALKVDTGINAVLAASSKGLQYFYAFFIGSSI